MTSKPTKKKVKVTLESIAQSINDLAIATAKGFEETNRKIGDGDDRLFKEIKDVEKTLTAKIGGLDQKIEDSNFHKTRDEVYSIEKRVSKIELEVGIKA